MDSFIHFFNFFVSVLISEQMAYLVTFCPIGGMKVLLLQSN
jgi:hypothetical protein